jgi:arylsulfatase A-like enzyme
MAKDTRPNVLLVIADQQRFDTIAAGVNNFGAATPNLDAMVRGGVLFSNMFTTCPICTPARSALFTGQMPSQVGMPGNLGNPNPSMNQNITTLGHRMQQAGYLTVYHGKSHLGTDLGQLGFKDAFENSHDPSTVTRACQFWRNRDWVVQKRPFFHVVSLLNPHDIYFLDPDEERPVELEPWPNRHDDRSTKPWPQQDHSRLAGSSDERWEYYRQFYRERLEILDRDVGTLTDELKMGGFAPNTYVIFLSDHGDMSGEHGVGFKGPFMYDCQTRIPMIIVPPRTGYAGCGRVSPPAGFKPHVSEVLATNLDIVPTVLDIAGVERPESFRGRSLMPAVAGDETAIHDEVFAELTMLGKRVNPIRMVRTRRWKYVFYLGHGEELYDMDADPWEMTNLADVAEHTKIKADLRERMLTMLRETGDSMFNQTPTDSDGKPYCTVPIDVPAGVPLGPTWGSDITWEK